MSRQFRCFAPLAKISRGPVSVFIGPPCAPLADLTAHLPITIDQGLTAAGIAESRKVFGANQLTVLPRESLWNKFVAKFDEPIIKILLAAAVLSMVVELFQADNWAGGGAVIAFLGAVAAIYLVRKAEWLPLLLFVSAFSMFCLGLLVGQVLVEGMAVMIAVVLATGVAFASEYKSDREFEVLNAHKESLQATVLRDGKIQRLPIEDVVVGDTITFQAGDEVPADGRVLQATELRLDQSLMTGEPEPVHKMPQSLDDIADGLEDPGCLYRGTHVVEGIGRMLVTEVGDATALGQIARRLGADDDAAADVASQNEAGQEKRVRDKLTLSKELTPLQGKLTVLARPHQQGRLYRRAPHLRGRNYPWDYCRRNLFARNARYFW